MSHRCTRCQGYGETTGCHECGVQCTSSYGAQDDLIAYAKQGIDRAGLDGDMGNAWREAARGLRCGHEYKRALSVLTILALRAADTQDDPDSARANVHRLVASIGSNLA